MPILTINNQQRYENKVQNQKYMHRKYYSQPHTISYQNNNPEVIVEPTN
jgi:hypothetical protein